ncbi:MAG TPA: SDR family NAD(P)-dependent oxidoreductase [Ensifer sp.]|nr:SDR family NAD(P)-dependent oxidoreductase [Ensifer sp.]
MLLDGIKALVTGGSSGVGQTLALRLVDAGATVIITGRDSARLDAAAEMHPGKIIPIATDLADPAAVDDLIATLHRDHPDLSLLVNNAGVQYLLDPTGDDPENTLALAREEIAVNLAAPAALTIGLTPLLKRRGQAMIVNISSGLAVSPKTSAPIYCATKAALGSLTRTTRYRMEDVRLPVRVMHVVLPLVDTPMTTGRGSGKMTPEAVAGIIADGIHKDRNEVWIGKARILRFLAVVAPGIAVRLLRNS